MDAIIVLLGHDVLRGKSGNLETANCAVPHYGLELGFGDS
jgi:hypothetical protein